MYRICLDRDDTHFEAVLPMHSSGYAAQWNAHTPHTSVQDQRYDAPVPYVNEVVCGYGVWSETQQSVPFTPLTAMVIINPLEGSRRSKCFYYRIL